MDYLNRKKCDRAFPKAGFFLPKFLTLLVIVVYGFFVVGKFPHTFISYKKRVKLRFHEEFLLYSVFKVIESESRSIVFCS